MEHIYVAAGRAGLLKVGKTADPLARRRGLCKEFKARGDVLEKFHACGALPNANGAELSLIDSVSARCRKAFGREWFRDGSFPLAVRAAEELTEYYAEFLKDWKPFTVSAENAEWLRGQAEQRAESKALRAAWRAEADAAQARRRRLRNPGVHAFDRLAQELRPDVRWQRVADATWPHPAGRPCIDVAAPQREAA